METLTCSLLLAYLFSIFKDLQTNVKGRYKMGEFFDRQLGDGYGLAMKKGKRIGHFCLGSSVVLIFEAPVNFRFNVKVGQTVKYGQPLGTTELPDPDG